MEYGIRKPRKALSGIQHSNLNCGVPREPKRGHLFTDFYSLNDLNLNPY